MKYFNVFYNLSKKYLYTNFMKQVIDLFFIIFSFVISSYITHFPDQERIISSIFFLSFSSLTISYFMDLRRHLWRVTSLYNIIDILKYSFAVSKLTLLRPNKSSTKMSSGYTLLFVNNLSKEGRIFTCRFNSPAIFVISASFS